MSHFVVGRRIKSVSEANIADCRRVVGEWRSALFFELAIMECWFLYDYKTCKDNKKNCDNKTAYRMSARSYIIFLLSDKKKI